MGKEREERSTEVGEGESSEVEEESGRISGRIEGGRGQGGAR
jgi:hypothetical protein